MSELSFIIIPDNGKRGDITIPWFAEYSEESSPHQECLSFDTEVVVELEGGGPLVPEGIFEPLRTSMRVFATFFCLHCSIWRMQGFHILLSLC